MQWLVVKLLTHRQGCDFFLRDWKMQASQWGSTVRSLAWHADICSMFHLKCNSHTFESSIHLQCEGSKRPNLWCSGQWQAWPKEFLRPPRGRHHQGSPVDLARPAIMPRVAAKRLSPSNWKSQTWNPTSAYTWLEARFQVIYSIQVSGFVCSRIPV